MNTPRLALNAVLAAAVLTGMTPSALAAPYKVDTLPQAPYYSQGTLGTTATDINNNGEVAGRTEIGESGMGSAYWDAAGQVTNLTPGDDPAASTAGISDAGTVVYSSFGRFYAWNAGTATDLGAGYPTAVNGKGQIAGTFNGLFGIWTEGVVSPLPLPPAGTAVHVYDLNNNGDAAGYTYKADVGFRAAVWRNGTVEEIATFPGHTSSIAYAINDAGQVVGYSADSTKKWRAFLWDNGVSHDLGLATDGQSFATGINTLGQAVGGAVAPGSYNNRPFVWQNGVRSDLSAVLSSGNCSASDINDNGALIVSCTGDVIEGPRIFRLTPVASTADLSVKLSATPIPATAGVPLVYTTTVTNIGNVAAPNAILMQKLPASGFTPYSITSSHGSCGGSTDILCTFGDLEAGASAVVTITATPLPVSRSAYFESSAAVETSAPEVNTVNNSQRFKFTVFENNAALRVDSKNSQTSAVRNGNITYTWEVSNGGPQAASNVVLTDTLPSSLSFVSVKTTAGACTGTVTITCNLGEHKYGPVTVTIVAKATVRGTITNSATVTSTTPDTYLGDNKATVTTRVR